MSRLKRSTPLVSGGGADLRRLLGTREAADYLAASPAAVRRWVASGRLTPVRIDRKLRFDIQDLDLLIEACKGDS